MNDGTLDAQPQRSSTVVKCEKHGLHYDSSKASGCVICRREAGGGATGMRTAAEAQSGSLGQALLVTLILLVLTTAGLYMAHGLMVKNFRELMPGQGDEPAFDSGLESAEPADTYSGPEGDGD